MQESRKKESPTNKVFIMFSKNQNKTYGKKSMKSSDVTRCAEASKCVLSSGGVAAKCVSRPASLRGGAKEDDVRSCTT